MLALRQGQRPLGRLSNSQHALSSCSTRQTSLPKLTSSSSSSSTPSPIASSSRLPSSPRLIINRRYAAVTLVRPKRPESNEKPTSATSSPVVPSVKQDRDASADLARRRRARLASNTLVNAKRLVKQLKQKPVEQLRVDEQVEEQEKELEDEQDQNQGQAKEVELEKDHPRQIPYVRETRSSIAESPEAADLLRKRPRNPPRLETWDPEYVKPYRKVYIDIETAFTRRQLRVMSHELKFRANSKESKTVLITRILEQWGWKAPTERPKLTPGERVFDLPAPELFLFLRDADLLRKQVQKGVRFSVVPAANEGKVLRAQGEEEQLKRLTEILQIRRTTMTRLDVSTSQTGDFRPTTGLLQVVSNVTGAYVEESADSRYHISAMNESSASQARRLLLIAGLRSHVQPPTRAIAALYPAASAESLDFSLIPFQPSPSNPPPWDSIRTAYGSPMFRLRKITVWAPKPGRREMDHRDESIEESQILILRNREGVDGSPSRETVEMEKHFAQSQAVLGDLGAARRLTTLTFGHLLFHPDDSGPISALSSPISGQWPLTEARRWLSSNSDRPVFSPGSTPTMVHFALTNKARRIRRLRYRSGSESLTFTYTYPERKLPEEAGSSQEDTELPVVEKKEERSWMEQLEGMLDEMDPEEKGEVAYASGEQSDPQPRTGNRDGPEELTWAGAMTEGSTVDDMVTAAGLPDVAEVMEEDTETVEQSTKTNRPPTGQTSEARYEEPSESARQSDSGRNETPRDTPEELTWAGSLTEGSTADDTVAAAGHPDAEEVMQADIGEAEHSASEHPSSSGEASGGGRDVEESDAERPSSSGTTEMDGLTAHGAADRFEHSTMARDDPERDPLSSIENLTWAGPMQVGSSAEDAVVAGGHAGAAEEMQAELRESGETGGPISSTHVDDALPFTAETALVCEEDVMLPDRPIDLRLHIQAINIVSGQEIPGDITTFFAALDSSHRDPQSWSAPPPTAPEIVNLVLSRKEWRLEQDEELQVIESRPQSEQIVLRSVKSIDKVLGIDRAVGYTELEYEGDTLPPAFWRELANISRDVGPNAASKRNDSGLFF